VRFPIPLREKRSPAAVSPSSVSFPAAISVLYPLASALSLFLAAAHRFFFDCAHHATLMIYNLSPPLDASAWVEIPLALVGDIVVAYQETPWGGISLPSGIRLSPPAPTRSRDLPSGR